MGVIFLTLFLDLVGFSIIFPLFPSMLEYYLDSGDGTNALLGPLLEALHSLSGTAPVDGLPHPQVVALFGGILGSLYSLLQFISAPFWGSLSDRIGRRPVLIVTITGIAISYVLWFFSGSFEVLVAARVVGGLMSGNIGAATAAIADSTTAENRAKGMGMVGAAFGLGFIAGPAIGGALSLVDLSAASPSLAAFGANPFSAAAGGALLLSVLNWIWVYRRFDETLPPEKRGEETSAERSSNPLRLFRPVDLPGTNLTSLINFFFIFSFSGMEFSLTFLAADRFDYGAGKNALLLSFAGLTMAFVQGGLIRRLAPKHGEVRLARVGLATILPGLVLIAFATSEFMLYVAVFLLAVGAAIVIPCLRALVSLYTPAERQGEVLGIFNSLGALARVGGPIAAAVAYWTFTATFAYVGGAAILLIPLALTVKLIVPRKDAPTTG